MRILYIARHHQAKTSLDDEGAIAHALRVLGHSVVLVDQNTKPVSLSGEFDLALGHKLEQASGWYDYVKGRCRLALWYFDQVRSPDPSLNERSGERLDWADIALRRADFLFMTDGDFVDSTPGVHLLRQGADERWWGKRPISDIDLAGQVLVTAGIAKSGLRRNFIADAKTLLGSRLKHYPRGLYGDDFRRAVATADYCIAPHSPSTNYYWSNRVYVTLAAGGVLLHPHCSDLLKEFVPGIHLVTYKHKLTSEDLDRMPTGYDAELMRLQASDHMLAHHLYRHRLETLLHTVMK